MHKILCRFGIHTWGNLFHKDRKRHVEIEFPSYKRIEVTDERVYRKCAVCSKEKLILAIDSSLR